MASKIVHNSANVFRKQRWKMSWKNQFFTPLCASTHTQIRRPAEGQTVGLGHPPWQKTVCTHVLDLKAVSQLYPLQVQKSLQAETLNELMGLDFEAWDVVRTQTQKLLSKGSELDQNVDLKAV